MDAIMSPELRAAREGMKRIPVSSLADLFTLDPDEIMQGYEAGREGMLCGENMTRAYFHGWRVGQMDSGRMEPDVWAMTMIRDMRARGHDLSTVAEAHRKQFAWLRSMGLA